ncbi:MAG: MarR family transcriptional regulator [Actinomycetes bacterium]|jgi:DNA-binding MarR family transcriptional regulator
MATKKIEPRWLNPREMKAWRSYIIASRRLLEALDVDLEGHDLSMSDYEVLAQLSDAPGRKMRMSELAEIAMISKSRLSHRMKVMEEAGWVKREECLEDKRGYFAVMTDRGWKAIVKAAPDHVSSVRHRFVDHLTSKDQEDLAKIFDRVQGQLRDQFLTEVKPVSKATKKS